jgi:hypothetical protein
MDLLFILAHWHGLSKLRLHTDTTLDIMHESTTSLGEKLREFQDHTCSAFATSELPREVNARIRQHAKKSALAGQASKAPTAVSCTSVPEVQPGAAAAITDTAVAALQASGASNVSTASNRKKSNTITSHRRQKTFNLNTYKHHALGDVVDTIRRYGTTDSYSTEPVSLYINHSFISLTMLYINRENLNTTHPNQDTHEPARKTF